MTAFKTLKPSTLGRDAFVAAFADIYEHSPWVAEQAFDLGQDERIDEIDGLHQRMAMGQKFAQAFPVAGIQQLGTGAGVQGDALFLAPDHDRLGLFFQETRVIDRIAVGFPQMLHRQHQ